MHPTAPVYLQVTQDTPGCSITPRVPQCDTLDLNVFRCAPKHPGISRVLGIYREGLAEGNVIPVYLWGHRSPQNTIGCPADTPTHPRNTFGCAASPTTVSHPNFSRHGRRCFPSLSCFWLCGPSPTTVSHPHFSRHGRRSEPLFNPEAEIAPGMEFTPRN
jgi:hypothetical protein